MRELGARSPQSQAPLRSTAFAEESDTADWLLDLLAKLGREEDAYDAVGLIVPEWGAPVPADDAEGASEDAAPIALEPVVDAHYARPPGALAEQETLPDA